MFSVQQQKSDKMLCRNVKEINKKYNLENETLINERLVNHRLDMEKSIEKRNESVDIKNITGLNSRTETCKLYDF